MLDTTTIYPFVDLTILYFLKLLNNRTQLYFCDLIGNVLKKKFKKYSKYRLPTNNVYNFH